MAGMFILIPLIVPSANVMPSLYGPRGVTPQAVRQGTMGSCYFHAAVAALAGSNPEMIKRLIRCNADSSYTVEFPDGKKETAYLKDIQFARDSGYDLSDGLWVSVLFRAYAQRTLRSALLGAIDGSALTVRIKSYVREFAASNDACLLAYDRAIRSVVDQNGIINADRLKAALRRELPHTKLFKDIEDTLVGLLDSHGVFAGLEAKIRESGELFGAYRAVGQGGLPQRVLEALTSRKALTTFITSDRNGILKLLSAAPGLPAVVGTPNKELALHSSSSDSDWFSPRHAYTVLGYDASTMTVTILNPWGDKPSPDGILGLSFERFLGFFETAITLSPSFP